MKKKNSERREKTFDYFKHEEFGDFFFLVYLFSCCRCSLQVIKVMFFFCSLKKISAIIKSCAIFTLQKDLEVNKNCQRKLRKKKAWGRLFVNINMMKIQDGG